MVKGGAGGLLAVEGKTEGAGNAKGKRDFGQLGHRRTPASGEHSRGVCRPGDSLSKAWREHLHRLWPPLRFQSAIQSLPHKLRRWGAARWGHSSDWNSEEPWSDRERGEKNQTKICRAQQRLSKIGGAGAEAETWSCAGSRAHGRAGEELERQAQVLRNGARHSLEA